MGRVSCGWGVIRRDKREADHRPMITARLCSKQSTDKAYDDALKLLLRRISSDLKEDPKGVPLVGAYFGTHNKESCDLVKDRLVAEGLGEEDEVTGRVKLLDGVAGRVCTGQLYGMSDELTERVAATYERSGTPMASKYLPYGALREVSRYGLSGTVAYLARR